MNPFCFTGDEIEVETVDGPLICVSCSSGQDQPYRLKNLTYSQFLIVKNGNICLSSFNTDEDESKLPINSMNVCVIMNMTKCKPLYQ